MNNMLSFYTKNKERKMVDIVAERLGSKATKCDFLRLLCLNFVKNNPDLFDDVEKAKAEILWLKEELNV